MKLEKDGKTLYHIQSISDYTDEPMDYFVLLDRYPTRDDVLVAIQDDFEDKNDQWIDDILENHNVYTVYTTEV